MSEIAIGRSSGSEVSFTRRAAVVMAGVGILAFIAMLVLGAYAPELRSGRNGGAHALSNAVTGFSGIVRLAEATGRRPQVVRSPLELESENLVVVTPEEGRTDLSEILDLRSTRATLLVLPKWETQADPKKPGWVRVTGIRPLFDTEQVLAPAYKLTVRVSRGGGPLRTLPDHAPPEMRFTSPGALQTIAGDDLRAVVTDRSGRIVLGQVGSQQFYILADPDLLNNRGMNDQQQALAGLALLDFLNSTDADRVLFDVTSNGLGATRSPLKLLFEPPFLAVTLAIAAALLLAGVQALTRFGSARRPERAIRFGKAALVDNTAALVRRAGREAQLGYRYAQVARRRAASLLRLPPALSEADLDARLDAVRTEGPPFTALAAQTERARSREELTVAARGLHHWLKELKA